MYIYSIILINIKNNQLCLYVVFTKQNNNPDYIYGDEDDIETIIYRNYSVEEIKEYIEKDLRTWWEE